MKDHANLDFTKFRDTIYDILVYNLDTAECIYYILSYFIQNNMLSKSHTSQILNKIYPFLKYYNNNYRPIYHLGTILIYIIIKLGNYDDYEQFANDKGICTKTYRNKSTRTIKRNYKKKIPANGT